MPQLCFRHALSKTHRQLHSLSPGLLHNRFPASNWLPYLSVIASAAALAASVAFDPRLAVGLAALLLLSLLILPRPLLGLYFFIALLPFEYPTALGANFTLIKGVALLTLTAWVIRLVRTKGLNIDLRDQRFLLLALFLTIAILSLTQATLFSRGLVRISTLALLIGLFFLTVDLVRTKETLRTVLHILFFSGALAALIPISQYLLLGGRADGSYSNPNYTALNLLALIPLAYIFLAEKTGTKKLIYWVALLLLFGGILVTFSRGIGIALAIVLVLLSLSKAIDLNSRRVIIVTLALVVLLAIGLSATEKRYSASEVTRGSGRSDIWNMAPRMFLDNWWLGVGLGSYPAVYFRYISHTTYVRTVGVIAPVGAHNMLIETAVETGIAGFTALLAFLGSVLLSLRKTRRTFFAAGDTDGALMSSMLMVGLIAILVGSLTNSMLFQKVLWIFLALATAQTRFPIKSPTLPEGGKTNVIAHVQ